MGAFVTADPDTRIITVTKVPVSGVSALDAVVDIYSDLKEDWLNTPTLQKLIFPFSSFSFPTSPDQDIGPYSFFDNASGWRMLPYDDDYELTIIGNIIPSDVTLPVWLERTGRTITITQQTSSQALTNEVGAGGGSIKGPVFGDL